MLGERSPQRGMFEADHLYLGFVGEDTFYGFLARRRRELFRDEDFAEFYSHLSNCDPARDLFVVTVDDVVVGYARTEWSQEIAGERALVHDVICFLDPAWTRRGIGQAMLATLEARVREIGCPPHLRAPRLD